MSQQTIDGPEWVRADARIAGVRAGRTIEIVVIPYESPAAVTWDGRAVRETIARGAFDGIERRPNRIRANRDHKVERTVGRAVAMHPARDEGLVAEIKISQTELGEETLQLAADGCLDASAGFLPYQDGMRWDGPDEYTVTKAWLGHVAFTPEPAHDGTHVLAIRSAGLAVAAAEPVTVSLTPNLDAFRAQLAGDRAAALAASLNLA